MRKKFLLVPMAALIFIRRPTWGFRRRARLLPLTAAVAAALATTLITSGPAMASGCSVAGSISDLTLTNAQNLRGIVTHGVGAQLTIQGTQADYATWTFHAQATGGFTIEDANGNCLRVAHTNQATVANGCDPSSNYQLWFADSPGGNNVCEFQNFLTGGYLKTLNQNDGDNVWVGPAMPGDFLKWTAA